MEKSAKAAAYSAVGAVVGAGLASGQEIDGFFARYGAWGFLGVGAAVVVMGLLTGGIMRRPGAAGMPLRWRGTWRARLWQGMFALLALASGGAMLAGAGEVAALMLPIPWARGVGVVGTLLMASWLGREGGRAMSWVSRLLVAMLTITVLAGLALPDKRAALVWRAAPLDSLMRGASYGGMNMALAAPLLALASEGFTRREKRQCTGLFLGLMAAVLTAGTALLLKHSALQGQTLPFLRMMGYFGLLGQRASALTLYLALLTTAGAAKANLQALLPDRPWIQAASGAGMLLVSLLGFQGMVGAVYPLLGALCLGLMTAALLSSRGEK